MPHVCTINNTCAYNSHFPILVRSWHVMKRQTKISLELNLNLLLCRCHCCPGSLCSVSLSTSIWWCSWTWPPGVASPCGWESVSTSVHFTSRRDIILFVSFISSLPLLSCFPPGFAIYFGYGIRNSTEAANSPSRKYEPALQNKSPIYIGGEERELEGISPW